MQLNKMANALPKHGRRVRQQWGRNYLKAEEVLLLPVGAMVMFRKKETGSPILCRVVKFGHSRKRKRLQSMRDMNEYFFVRDYPGSEYWKAERRPESAWVAENLQESLNAGKPVHYALSRE